MILDKVEPSGRRKQVERRMVARCQFCGAVRTCPSEAVEWAWCKDGDTLAFLAEHRAHGFDRMVGVEVEFVDVE